MKAANDLHIMGLQYSVPESKRTISCKAIYLKQCVSIPHNQSLSDWHSVCRSTLGSFVFLPQREPFPSHHAVRWWIWCGKIGFIHLLTTLRLPMGSRGQPIQASRPHPGGRDIKAICSLHQRSPVCSWWDYYGPHREARKKSGRVFRVPGS